eukprot:m.261923 g.261923  ORF g.261923 m.261923 type:complete len:141 (+) comp43788_c0_seq1:185-607(+)
MASPATEPKKTATPSRGFYSPVDTTGTIEPDAPVEPPKSVRPDRVVIVLKAVGRAPQLLENKKKFKISGESPFKVVADHVTELIKNTMKPGDSLFLYTASAHISPSLDQNVANLAMSFGRRTGKGGTILDVTYGVAEAWG